MTLAWSLTGTLSKMPYSRLFIQLEQPFDPKNVSARFVMVGVVTHSVL